MTSLVIRKSSIIALAALAIVLVPQLAFASGRTFEDSIGTVTEQTKGIPELISIVLYIIGIALVGKGILVGKKFSENPSSVTGGLFAVLGPIAVGALLIAAPSVAKMAISSLGQDDNASVDLNTFGGVDAGGR